MRIAKLSNYNDYDASKFLHKTALKIWYRYWLKTGNVHSVLEQNTDKNIL